MPSGISRRSERSLNGVSTEVRAANKNSRAVGTYDAERRSISAYQRLAYADCGETIVNPACVFSVVYRGCEFFRNPVAVVGRRPNDFAVEDIFSPCAQAPGCTVFQRGRASLLNTSVADEYRAGADAQPLTSMAYALRGEAGQEPTIKSNGVKPCLCACVC
jgi:hypothetical protein